jgi:nucleoside-triphosphatase THEP1
VINILTGPVHSGKTTFLKNAILVLKENNFAADGYLSEAAWKGQEFTGYDLIDLKNDLRHPFIRKQGQEDWQKIGPFYFIPGTLDLAKKIIRRCQKADLCVVDEVGPLELEGKGVWPALEEAFKIPGQNLLVVVRETLLKDIMDRMPKNRVRVYATATTQKPLHMVEALMRGLKKRR